MSHHAKVLTVSESVSAGMREDRSGAALVSLLITGGFQVVERRTVPDGVAPVAAALRELATELRRSRHHDRRHRILTD